MEKSSQDIICQNCPTEKLYFCGLILYMLQYLQYETQWDYGSLVNSMLKMMVIASLTIHVFSTFSRYEDPLHKCLFIICLVITLIVGVNAKYKAESNLQYSLFVTFFLVFGAKNINFRKIVKVYLVVGSVYCIFTVLASLFGIIKNISDVSARADETIGAVDNFYRLSFGYGWSTNMANHVFFIFLTFFYWASRPLKKSEMSLFLGTTIFVLYYTGSRLSTACVLLMLLFSLLYKTNIGKKWIEYKFVSYFLIISIPLFALISYYVTESYDATDMDWLLADVVLSGRLRLGYDALEIAGIPLWGQFYEMFGSVRDDGNAYNYLDCSYIQSLVIYGLMYTLFIIFAYIYICNSAYKRKDYYLMYSVFFAGVSGLIAQHFIEMYMNPFLIALFANHTKAVAVNGNA